MSNRDLIEDIKAKLKESQELPYREGAWERFAAQQGEKKRPAVIIFKRLASIAAMGLAALGASMYLYNLRITSQTESIELAKSSNKEVVNNVPTEQDLPHNPTVVSPDASQFTNSKTLAYEAGVHLQQQDQLGSLSPVADIHTSEITPTLTRDLYTLADVSIVNTHMQKLPIYTLETPINTIQAPSAMTLAHQATQNAVNTDVDKLKQSTRMSLGDKFQLGLYVSPHRTSDQFDVGAGFLVSYAITKNISIRTGTSYNSYSVGVLKDPMETANAEMISVANASAKENMFADYSKLNTQMILPNINAVMGRVEALEIPLEVSYQLKKGFYTSAGVSYSAIISQEREAQYIDHGGVINLQENASLIPGAAQKVNKVETRTVKSMQNNVNPNGFSGFANFSMGKKVNVNNKMTLSLEPFVKVPIGQFRKSDLDYTNSGIRIITTF
jgi:hypothetical protein